MATYPLTALVLRKTKLGEADLILTLLGSDGALHKAIAKGARKPGSKFGGRAEPATVFSGILARGKSLDIISDARTIDSHHRIREDYDTAMGASVILDFAAKVSFEALEDERFFQLTVRALETLEKYAYGRSEPDTSLDETSKLKQIHLIVTAYLLKASAMQGYRMDLENGTESQYNAEWRDKDITSSLSFLLGATFAQIEEQDQEVWGDITLLFDTVRLFVRDNIDARLKALDAYTTLNS
ncbi:MAG: DNA repair protein RecO [Actinomycetia bacterium]|nr:DNA repair protein RecO [Actinomycetes bacterium]